MNYNVTLRETEVYLIESIFAQSEDEAEQEAWKLLGESGSGSGREKYWNDSETEAEIEDADDAEEEEEITEE